MFIPCKGSLTKGVRRDGDNKPASSGSNETTEGASRDGSRDASLALRRMVGAALAVFFLGAMVLAAAVLGATAMVVSRSVVVAVVVVETKKFEVRSQVILGRLLWPEMDNGTSAK